MGHCTRCGKEIEDGQNVCEDCQNKLLEEIINDEKEITSKIEVKDEKINSDDEKEEKNNKDESKEKFKVVKDNKKKSASKKILVLVLLIFVLVIAIIAFLYFNYMKVGNTVGNIRNYGYSTTDGNEIYYISPIGNNTKVGLYAVDKNGENRREIYISKDDILSLNSYGKYLYFITEAANAIQKENGEYEYDNKICRIEKDGSNFEIINDNEFNDYCYEIYVLKNKVYYIGEDSKIYKMNLDGTNRELVSDLETGYVAITNKYIIYNVEKEGSTEENPDYETYVMNIDGTNPRPIIKDTRLYTINVVNDVVYYTDEDLKLYSINIDGTNKKELLDTEVYNLNVVNDYIFYLNYADIANGDSTICVYRANLDGSDNKIIKKLESGTSFINVVGDWILYMDSSSESGYIKIVNKDGEEEKNLYEVNLLQLYQSIENTTVEETIVGEDTAENEVTNGNDVANETSASENTNTSN